MVSEEFRCAIPRVPLEGLSGIQAALYAALMNGTVGEAEAAELESLIAARRAVATAQPKERRVNRAGARPRAPEHLERRRTWLARGYLPPRLVGMFTPGEAAALAVVADRTGVWGKGQCTLSVARIAEEAGVCETVVHNALRLARARGLLQVTERRVARDRNRTNAIALTSPVWVDWIGRRSAKAKRAAIREAAVARTSTRGGGCISVHPETQEVLVWAPEAPRGSRRRATEVVRAGADRPRPQPVATAEAVRPKVEQEREGMPGAHAIVRPVERASGAVEAIEALARKVPPAPAPVPGGSGFPFGAEARRLLERLAANGYGPPQVDGSGSATVEDGGDGRDGHDSRW